MAEFILNNAVVTKKIIDLLVDFIRKNARRSKLYENTHVTDRFSLEAVRLPSIIVRNVTNTQRRTHYDDFIDDITGRIQLVPISGDSTLVGSNLVRTNLADSLDYDPRWAFDPTIGYPTGLDITAAIFTSQTGGSFNSGVTTGMIITLPPPNDFDPASLVYGLESPLSDGSNNYGGVPATNPINPNFRTVNSTGLILENHTNNIFNPLSSGNIQVPLNLSVLPNYTRQTINYSITGTQNIDLFSPSTTGINAVYSGNNTTYGKYPFSGIGISGAGWYQSGTSLQWTNGIYPNFSGAIVAGQIPASGSLYGVDYNYYGPDVHTLAVALSADQEQFYLIYSGISLAGSIAIQPVDPGQYIVNASGLVPGLSGTVFKLNDVLWAGDQYQALTFQQDQLNYAVYGGLYEMSISFECYANSTIEAQELGDLVEKFLVENKKQPYNADAFNLTAWSQGGQSEEEYINDHIFSTSVSVDGFRFWQEYRGADIITSVSGTAIPIGFYNNLGSYIPPGVVTNLTLTN